MYVCLCNSISDKVIRKAVHQYQPRTMKQLRQIVPVGTECGKCIKQARIILEEEQTKIANIDKVA
ncbi:bacterioferritin-associated ferredoxin [Affinibrenneria salicis]|uniref:Bacterioferritin-associated ferredoxin n=1 Tax=Affinibrenneria salicis TaxID=2590031 RepID=A0A5J5FQK3_9GAMM|nr:bacterioferritin-associated ferredoxin [Affinibrenneria salicis]KAA8994833.1 bacterioferritin-associated ferredoxin [Affinibrenneria salicis]